MTKRGHKDSATIYTSSGNRLINPWEAGKIQNITNDPIKGLGTVTMLGYKLSTTGALLVAAGYRYWKLLTVTSSGDKTYNAMYEVEFQIAGVDQATTGNATTGSVNGSPARVKEYAFDNNLATKWAPHGGASDTDTWVGQDLGSSQEIDKVRFYPEYDTTGNIQYVRVYADSQADFSTETLLGELTTTSAGSWNEIVL